MTRSPWLALTLAILGCRGDDRDARDQEPAPLPTKLSALLVKLRDAVPADPATLPACAPGAEAGHLRVHWTTLDDLADGRDLMSPIPPDRAGAPVFLCSFYEDDAMGHLHSPWRLASTVATAAAVVDKAAGLAIARALTLTEPGTDGSGKVSGYVVLVSRSGTAECAIPVSATNDTATLAYATPGTEHNLTGPSFTDAEKRRAWDADFASRTCRALIDATPRAIDNR